jgi:hypothetical protein
MDNTQSRLPSRRRQRLRTHGWPHVTGWAAAILLAASGFAQAEPGARQPAAGSTVETAILLPSIADEFHGAAAEHTYIAAHFPAWHIEYQSPQTIDGRHYDLLGMIEPDGTRAALYFDTTDWFGK